MAEKKTEKRAGSGLPVNTEDLTPSANITYNNEVVAIIAGLAANEVGGIAGMCNVSGSLMGKNRNITKGVKVEVGTEEVAVDLYVAVDYGTPIKRAAADAQENVRKAIESMTGLHVVRVDVHVQSVSFEQEKKALQAGAQNAALTAGSFDAAEEEPKPVKKAEPKAKKAEESEAVKEEEPKAEKAEESKAKEPDEEPAPAEEKKKDVNRAAVKPAARKTQKKAPAKPAETEEAEKEKKKTAEEKQTKNGDA